MKMYANGQNEAAMACYGFNIGTDMFSYLAVALFGSARVENLDRRVYQVAGPSNHRKDGKSPQQCGATSTFRVV